MSDIPLFGHYDFFLTYFYLYNTIPIMTIIFSIFIFLLAINFKMIIREFSKINKKSWIILAIIFIIGFWLRNAEYVYGIHTDAFQYAESARYLIKDGIFVRDCSVGNIDNCKLYEQVLYTPGYPYLISILYAFFGINTIFGSVLSAFLSGFTIILIFFIGYVLFKNEDVGLYSALVFSLIPLDLYFANTGNLRSSSLFFISLTILFYLFALRKNTIKIWSLLAITFSFSILLAKENSILLLPMFFGLFIFEYYNLRNFNLREIKKIFILSVKKFSIPIFILIITQIPVQYWIINFEIPQTNVGKSFLSIEYFKIMAPIIFNTLFIKEAFNTYFYNPVVSFIFLISSIFIVIQKKHRPQLIFLWVIFLIYFITYSSYFHCPNLSQNLCFDYIRMLLLFHLPYSILAGYTLFNLRFLKREYFISLVFIFLLLTTPITFPQTIFKDSRMEKPEFQAKYFKAVNSVPNNCTIMTSMYMIPTSDVFPNNSRKTINIYIIFPNTYPDVEQLSLEQISESSCNYYFEDGFCSENYREEYNCKFIYEKLNLEYLYTIDDIKVYNVTLP